MAVTHCSSPACFFALVNIDLADVRKKHFVSLLSFSPEFFLKQKSIEKLKISSMYASSTYVDIWTFLLYFFCNPRFIYFFNFIIHFSPRVQPLSRLNQRFCGWQLERESHTSVCPAPCPFPHPLEALLIIKHFFSLVRSLLGPLRKLQKRIFCADLPFSSSPQFMSNLNFSLALPTTHSRASLRRKIASSPRITRTKLSRFLHFFLVHSFLSPLWTLRSVVQRVWRRATEGEKLCTIFFMPLWLMPFRNK